MDTTFFGRYWGILMLMDSNPNNVISHYFVRTEKDYLPYKHRNVRSAYVSLKRYMGFIFTYEKHPELNLEKMTNCLEGLFSELKLKLNNHNGLTRRRKMFFINDFLNKKSY